MAHYKSANSSTIYYRSNSAQFSLVLLASYPRKTTIEEFTDPLDSMASMSLVVPCFLFSLVVPPQNVLKPFLEQFFTVGFQCLGIKQK